MAPFFSHTQSVGFTEQGILATFYTPNIQPVVKPVWQQVVSCKGGFAGAVDNCAIV